MYFIIVHLSLISAIGFAETSRECWTRWSISEDHWHLLKLQINRRLSKPTEWAPTFLHDPLRTLMSCREGDSFFVYLEVELLLILNTIAPNDRFRIRLISNGKQVLFRYRTLVLPTFVWWFASLSLWKEGMNNWNSEWVICMYMAASGPHPNSSGPYPSAIQPDSHIGSRRKLFIYKSI